MKNILKILEIVLVFGITVVGCDNGSTIIPIVYVDLGNGIKAEIEAFHYGPDSFDRESSKIFLCFYSYDIAIDNSGSGYDYIEDFVVKVDEKIFTPDPYNYVPNHGSEIRFTNEDGSIITAGQEHQIQIKYTANPNRKIRIGIPNGGGYRYDTLSSFDTGVKTVIADHW